MTRIPRGLPSKATLVRESLGNDPSKVRDYGKVDEYAFGGFHYLAVKNDPDANIENDIKRVQSVMDKIPEEDKRVIGFIILDYNNLSEGRPEQASLDAEAYDGMGKKNAMAFLRARTREGREWGLMVNPLWSEGDDARLFHVVAHEVGHVSRANSSYEMAVAEQERYQRNVKLAIEDPRIKPKISKVERLETGDVHRVLGLYDTRFDSELWQKYGFPSEYALKNDLEYHAEMYAHRLEHNLTQEGMLLDTL